MEAGLLEEHACGRREPIHVSQSIPLPREFSPIELVDVRKEGKLCEHFTIRGYVADVRKKNPEICWPFSMLHNHKLYENGNLFPPLRVTEFRHWNCEHCLHGIDPSAALVADGTEADCQHNEVKGISTSVESASLASQSGEELLLPCFQQISDGKMLGEQLLAAGSFIGVSNVESSPKVCPAMKENESTVKDLKKGLDILKAGHDTSEVIWNLASDTVATKHREHSGEGTMMPMGIDSVHEISGSEMAADPTFAAINVGISGQKQYNDTAKHVLDIGSMELDESDHDSRDNDMGQAAYTSQPKKRVGETLIADKHRRKARKVRLLDDIMRSEGSDVMSKQVEEAKDGRNGDDIDRRPHTCKGIDRKSHLADQKTHVESSMSKPRHTLLLNEDKDPLMYCLKRVSKKDMTHKGHTKIKPKRTTNAFAGKRLNCFHDFSGAKVHKSKKILERKKKEMPLCSINPQQKTVNTINLSDSEDTATNNPHIKAIDPQFKGILVSSQASHHSSKIRGNHSKDSKNKKKNKAPQIGDGGYCHMHLSKESFSQRACENITGFQEPTRVPKKKRTGSVSKKVVDDDIPMDIVELLARNQHQRRLMEAKKATIDKSINEYDLEAADNHGKLVADAVLNDFSPRKNLSCNTVTYLGNNKNANSSKHTSPLDVNKKDVLVASTGLPTVPEYRSHPMNHTKSPNFKSKNDHLTQNSSGSKERPLIPESCQTLGRKSRGLSWMPVNLKIVTHERANQKLVNQDGSHPLNINEQAESSINKRPLIAATSELGNTIYRNKTTPPIHFLKPMDPVAWVGTSHTSVDTNKSRFIESSNSATNHRCHEFTGLLSRAQIPRTHKNSLLVETLPPLPRVGIFGSFLQKEITSRANTCATQIDMGIGHNNKLKSHEPKDKLEWPYLGTCIRMDGQQNPISGYQLSTQFGAKIINLNHSKSCETKRKAKSESSHMATSSRGLNDLTPIYTNENINQMFSYVNSIKNDMFQININSAAAVQSQKTDICVMNQNPADFTVLDKNNAYMIQCEGLGPRNAMVP